MSTTHKVYCEDCREYAVDFEDMRDPEIVVSIVENVAKYVALAKAWREVPIPDHAWIVFELKMIGERVDLDLLEKHATHRLVAIDEYGFWVIDECRNCKKRYCYESKPYSVGPCCGACTHTIKSLAKHPHFEDGWPARVKEQK